MSTTPDAPPDPLPEPPADYDAIAEEEVSALPTALGMKLVEWRAGFAAMECVVAPVIMNRQGVVHGGALATLIDTAAGYAPVFCPYPGRRRRAFTLSLNCQFLAAGRRLGERLRAEATMVGGGASVAFVNADIRGEDGVQMVTAAGVFRLRGDSRSPWGAPRDGS
ncbi:MAG: PaaI family thioesterase [Pseudomonadota bacterium]